METHLPLKNKQNKKKKEKKDGRKQSHSGFTRI